MNNESGEVKFNKCLYKVKIGQEATGTEKPAFACSNSKVKEDADFVLLVEAGEDLIDVAVLQGIGIRKELTVAQALEETCGPCELFINCQQRIA